MPSFAGLAAKRASANSSRLTIQQALEEPEEEKEEKSTFGKLKSGLGSALGSAGKALSLPGAIVVNTAAEIGDGISELTGIGPQGEFSLGDLRENIANRRGAGEMLADNDVNLGKWGNRIAGGALDIASDPLNLLGGTSAVAKGATAKAGSVLDEAARAAGSTGDLWAREALREGGTGALRTRLADVGADLDDVLARGTQRGSDAGAANVQRQLADLDKYAGGGIGVNLGSKRLALGTKTIDKATDAIRGSELGQATGRLFSPAARVSQELGRGAGDAVGVGLHSAGQAKRVARQELKEQIESGAIESLTTKEYMETVTGRMGQAMADDLAELAPEIISRRSHPGWKQIPGTKMFAPPSVAKTIADATIMPTSDLLKAVDAITATVKRYTTLGPLNAIPHVSRNMTSNKLFAAMFGGATDPRGWKAAINDQKALTRLVREGKEINTENLVALGVKDPQKAMAAHQVGLTGRNSVSVDDIGSHRGSVEDLAKKAKDPKKQGRLSKKAGLNPDDLPGTRMASKVNAWDEEVSRMAVFYKGLDEGLTPQLAAKKSRDAMLDYSAEGLSKFEREVLQRIVFFYKFPRRAVPAGVKFAVEHPGQAMAASRTGMGFDLGERNDFNEPIGQFFDTPLESAGQTLMDFGKNPIDAVVGMGNPVLQVIADEDKQGYGDIAPPLGMFNKLEDPKLIGTQPAGLLGTSPIPGARTGVDYDAVHEDEELTEKDEDGRKDALDRLSLGVTATPKDRLAAAAEAMGLEKAYGYTQAKLISKLSELGLDESKLLGLLNPQRAR